VEGNTDDDQNSTPISVDVDNPVGRGGISSKAPAMSNTATAVSAADPAFPTGTVGMLAVQGGTEGIGGGKDAYNYDEAPPPRDGNPYVMEAVVITAVLVPAILPEVLAFFATHPELINSVNELARNPTAPEPVAVPEGEALKYHYTTSDEWSFAGRASAEFVSD
jgi:hypothetical protein